MHKPSLFHPTDTSNAYLNYGFFMTGQTFKTTCLNPLLLKGTLTPEEPREFVLNKET